MSQPADYVRRRLPAMRWLLRGASVALVAAIFLPSFSSADDLDADEQAAIVAAVDRIAPAVVQIETIGGHDRVGGMLFGLGPTTGLLVDREGHVISSAFNFVNKPSSILVRLDDGVRRPAKLIATDHSRMLVLLKIDDDRNSASADNANTPSAKMFEIGPVGDLRIGQWTIAVGRTFDGKRPNLSVGILSALDRVWGKAIQTDAAVSPNNYGGPLLDIRGRVLGILVPLSPEAGDELAGVEWYDSGIGFAIPMEEVERNLLRLKQGEDLFPGLAGLGLKGPNIYTGEPIIAFCHPKGPAAAAGLKVGDRIMTVDGRKTARAADVKREIGCRYAGQKMHVTVVRDGEPFETDIELAKELEPLPEKDDGG